MLTLSPTSFEGHIALAFLAWGPSLSPSFLGACPQQADKERLVACDSCSGVGSREESACAPSPARQAPHQQVGFCN